MENQCNFLSYLCLLWFRRKEANKNETEVNETSQTADTDTDAFHSDQTTNRSIKKCKYAIFEWCGRAVRHRLQNGDNQFFTQNLTNLPSQNFISLKWKWHKKVLMSHLHVLLCHFQSVEMMKRKAKCNVRFVGIGDIRRHRKSSIDSISAVLSRWRFHFFSVLHSKSIGYYANLLVTSSRSSTLHISFSSSS